jgi:hypothetical protein
MRFRLLIVCLSIAMSVGLGASRADAAWTPAGDVLNVDATRSSMSPGLADIAGTPWVVWGESDAGGIYQVRAARWSGTAWSAVGGSLNVDPTRTAYVGQIADVGGTPYVAWVEYDGAVYQVRVKRWTGSAWQSVGGSLNVDATKMAREVTITSSAGTPFVAWQEQDASGVNQIRAKRWDGAAWTSRGAR